MLSIAHPFDTIFDMPELYPRSHFVTRRIPDHRFSLGAPSTPALKEHDDKYVLSLNAPGVSKDEIKLTTADGILTLEITSSATNLLWRSRLPRDADTNAAHGLHVDGILTVTIPKDPTAFDELEHPGVECDRSGMKPIKGKRYHLTGHNFDLCEAEFAKLGEREKALYQSILPPPKKVKLDVPVSSSADDTTASSDDDDDEKAFTLRLNAAGVRASDVQVQVEDSMLTVRGETKATGARLAEQAFRLPRDADALHIRASSVDGLLLINIPKKLASPTVIQITNGPIEATEKAAIEGPPAGAGQQETAEEEDIVMA